MAFNTISFWIVFVVLVVIYQLIPERKRAFQNALLLIASYGFYAAWSIYYLPFIILSTVVDFFAGPWVGPNNKTWQRNLALFSSLSVNLGLLCTFKYVLDIVNPDKLKAIFGSAFIDVLINIGLPIGISFYTFQTLSYTFDVYRGKIKPTRNLQDFALYVSFFPQLLAGPIEKARRFLPQIQNNRSIHWKDYKKGITLILLGLFKKIYVADSLSFPIDFVFERGDSSSGMLILACILMVFRVYADFSGYSDMARGMAMFFGIKLVQNFKPFYISTSPNAFWRAWHISFMEWVRDYLVLPFINLHKKKEWMISLRILFALFIVGIWHEASLNWVAFGLMHGMALLLYRWWNLLQRRYGFVIFPVLGKTFGFLFMFNLYFFSGLLHRSPDFSQVLLILKSIGEFSGWHYGVVNLCLYILQILVPLIVYEFMTLKTKDEFFILKYHWIIRAFMMALALLFITGFERTGPPNFVYFDF